MENILKQANAEKRTGVLPAKELLREEFAGKTSFPPDWLVESAHHAFEASGVRGGKFTRLRIPIPGNGWDTLWIESEVEPVKGALIDCSLDELYILVSAKNGPDSRHEINRNDVISLAKSAAPVPESPGVRQVTFEFSRNQLRGFLDGECVIASTAPAGQPPFCGSILLNFWDDCRIRHVRLYGAGELPAPLYKIPPRKTDDFFLEVNVDFFDDLRHAPFTPAMFDRMFAEFESWGVRRCHWIYYGGRKNGWWQFAPNGVAANAARTVELSGEIFPAAVRAAHAHGIELIGMIKPFDMGFCHSYRENTPEAKEKGKVRRIGGPLGWIADFPVKHPEFLMARKPEVWGPAKNATFSRIDLVKDDERTAAFGVRDIRLLVSDDNVIYRPYTGSMVREEVVEDYPVWEHASSGGRPTGANRHVRVMRLRDLDISQKYFAIAVDSRSRSFANTLINLIHVFGEKGEERRLTYGTAPRILDARVKVQGAASVASSSDFLSGGVEFDVFRNGVNTAVRPGFNGMESSCMLDDRDGFIAVAGGKERAAIAALSPSFPEVRAWWLSWVQDCLDAGADGIELRMRNHHDSFTWAEFGFEPPVRDEFMVRYGVDLWKTDDFDRGAWRRLRGEAYTEFVRQTRELTRRAGKSLGLHVSASVEMEPGEGAAMDVHWDWRRWLDEGLADSVTLKEVWPNTRFEQEILCHTRPRGIQTIFCPYANNLWNTPGGEKIVEGWIRAARAAGLDGYQYYECASVVNGTPEGGMVMRQPALREVFRRAFK